jgi:hypothetical protein
VGEETLAVKNKKEKTIGGGGAQLNIRSVAMGDKKVEMVAYPMETLFRGRPI